MISEVGVEPEKLDYVKKRKNSDVNQCAEDKEFVFDCKNRGSEVTSVEIQLQNKSNYCSVLIFDRLDAIIDVP